MRTSKFIVIAQLALASIVLPAQARPDPPDAKSAANPSSNTQDSNTDELDLAVGENKTIPATDVKNYAEGVTGIADVKLTTDHSQFVVSGQKPGSTTLLLIKKDGTQQTWIVSVHARAVDAVEREINQLLIGTTGLRVRRVGGRIFIDGGVSTEPELKRIQQVAALYPGQVESLVAVGAPAADRKIDIRIDFFFVQYDKSKSYAFGVSWPSRLGGAGVVTSEFSYNFLAHTTTSAQASVMNQPLPALDMAANNGWAKVLKQSTVISSNGSEATFSSGGEQNFPITSGLVAGIKEVVFGTNLTVLPRYDPRTRDLAVTVKADVSDLVAPAASSIIPGRTTTHLDTSVDLKLGQSLVLSGIRSRSQRHAITGIPILSEIPVLGVLFGSHSDASEDTEGAIFIIPSVIEHIPQANMELINHTLAEYEDFSGDIDKVHTYSRRPPVLTESVGDSIRSEK